MDAATAIQQEAMEIMVFEASEDGFSMTLRSLWDDLQLLGDLLGTVLPPQEGTAG